MHRATDRATFRGAALTALLFSKMRDGQQMKILLAIDGSEFSQAALRSVIGRPWNAGTEIKVLHVVEPPALLIGREMGAYDPEFEAVWKALREQAKDLVEKATAKLRAAGFQVST